MKNLIYAAGFLTAGVASLALSTSLQAQDGSKRWTIGAGVRGFYDDNIFTRPDIDPVTKADLRLSSFGLELTPSVSFNLPLEQGRLDFGYTYGLRYYEDRPGDDIDQYHNFTGNFSHQFSPRYKIGVSENFAIAQEPEQIAGAGAALIPFRTEGDNVRNSAGVVFTAQITDPISADLSYNNNYYDYDNAQYGQALDRIEHTIGTSLRYQFRPTTFGSIGYNYGIYDYTSKDVTTINPQTKDQDSHFIYGGVDHNFTSKLLGSARVGVQIATWDKLGANLDKSQTKVTPYADGSLSYLYAAGSSVRVGVKHQRNATDLFDEYANPVLDTESTLGYVTVTHKITEKLNVSLNGLFQDSSFEAPNTVIDGESEQYWSFGVSLSYQFTRWLSGEASYYYDNLDSKLVQGYREYDRNRVFLGVRFSY